MQIIQLEAENVKRIKAIKIEPKDNMVIIEGKNAQGKTSALDCISYALGGKRLIPDNPIREGEESAFVKLDLGTYQVTRTWTKKNTYLKIENKDGFKSQNPQEMLDALIGDLSFDPMCFCNLDKNKRIEMLKKICKLDFDDLKAKYDKAYTERTQANKQIEQIEAQLKPYETLEPLTPVRDIKSVEKEREELIAHNRNIERAQEKHRENQQAQAIIINQINELQAKLVKINDAQIELEKVASQPLEDVTRHTQEVQEIIKQASLSKSHDFVKQLETSLKKTKDNHAQYEKEIMEVKAEKEKRLNDAQFPIKGLSLSSTDIIFKGIEFSQLSSSEKIKVSMAMAMALNPRIKIIRIMNGSLLDADAMIKIREYAQKHEFQVWVERVSNVKNDNTIYIEDGEIK